MHAMGEADVSASLGRIAQQLTAGSNKSQPLWHGDAAWNGATPPQPPSTHEQDTEAIPTDNPITTKSDRHALDPDHTSELDRSLAEEAQLMDQLASTEAESARLRSEIVSMQAVIRRIEAQNAALRTENARLDAETRAMEGMVEALTLCGMIAAQPTEEAKMQKMQEYVRRMLGEDGLQ